MRGKVWIASALILSGCAATGGKVEDLTPEMRLQRAKTWIKEGRYERAIGELQELLTRFPGAEWAPEARFFLGEAYYRSGDYASAVSEYGQVVEQYGLSPWAERAQFKIAMSYLRQSLPPTLDQEETRKALEAFRRFLEDYPDSPLAGEARRHVRECLDKLAEKLYRIGKVYLKLGHPEAAKIYFRDLLDEYPNSKWTPWAKYELGRIAMERGDLEEARRAFGEVLAGDGDERVKRKAREALKKLEVRG
ncbi:MAG TPA: outer membrane protein assembly factor BamD [Candidatus Latescibacteria bacterium]|nr:outer membrane protein assembly factor BamD [Candidatus Latescibacterota bacterium]